MIKKIYLSDGEERVTKLMLDGLSNQEIGEKLGIMEKSVKFHITNIFKKTGFISRLKLVVSFYKKEWQF